MQERDINLLFHGGVLGSCVVMRSPVGKGYIAAFCRDGTHKPDIILETRKRKSGEENQYRVFKTIDSACGLVKRRIGFNIFDVEL